MRVSTAIDKVIDKVPDFNTSLGSTFIEDIDHFEEELFEREELAKATYNSARFSLSQMFTQLNVLGSFFWHFYIVKHLQLTNISEKCLWFWVDHVEKVLGTLTERIAGIFLCQLFQEVHLPQPSRSDDLGSEKGVNC